MRFAKDLLSPRERKGAVGSANGKVRDHVPTALTPHPPTLRVGPFLSLKERRSAPKTSQPLTLSPYQKFTI